MMRTHNHKFISNNELSNAIFSYLGNVRNQDTRDTDTEPDSLDDSIDYTEQGSRFPGNSYSSKLVTRIPHVRSCKPAFISSIDNGDVQVTPEAGHRKRASLSDKIKSVGRIKLKDIDSFRRNTLKSPLIESAILGGITGLGVYYLAPWMQEKLGGSPKYIDRATGEVSYMTPFERKSWAVGTGLGIAALSASRGINFNDMSKSNILTFPKKASMLGPVDYVPKSFAMNAVYNNPTMPTALKDLALGSLGTIPGNPMINSTSMVTAGINSGASGLSGLPIGRVTAAATADALTAYSIGSLLGAHDPVKLATSVGLGSSLIRGIGNMI